MNSNSTKTYTPTVITEDVKSQLPIFQLLGNQLPAKMQAPEAKKTAGKVIYWSALAAIVYFFFANISTLLEFAAKSVLFVVLGIVLFVLISLAPQIIGFLNRIGRTMLFKGEQDFVSKNPVASLKLLMADMRDTLKKIKDKIISVEAVKIDMEQNAETQRQEAVLKAKQVEGLKKAMDELEKEIPGLKASGQIEEASKKQRKVNELKGTIQARMAEGNAAEQLSKQYIQYANQFGKVVEVLKDNESGATIYYQATNSSVNIIEAKLNATGKMRKATEGIADVFNIKDGWVFDTAMSAATAQISQNLATMKNNLENVAMNQTFVPGQLDTADVDAFLKRSESLKTLNIQEITDPSHQLTAEEKVDKAFNILD